MTRKELKLLFLNRPGFIVLILCTMLCLFLASEISHVFDYALPREKVKALEGPYDSIRLAQFQNSVNLQESVSDYDYKSPDEGQRRLESLL